MTTVRLREYSGDTSDDVVHWLRSVEVLGSAYLWTEEQMLCQAVAAITGNAAYWLDGVTITSWQELKAAMLSRFGESLETLAQKLYSCKQRHSESIYEYIDSFMQLSAKLVNSGSPMPDALLLHIFVKGTHRGLRHDLTIKHPRTLAQAIADAQYIESSMNIMPPPESQHNIRTYSASLQMHYPCHEHMHFDDNLRPNIPLAQHYSQPKPSFPSRCDAIAKIDRELARLESQKAALQRKHHMMQCTGRLIDTHKDMLACAHDERTAFDNCYSKPGPEMQHRCELENEDDTEEGSQDQTTHQQQPIEDSNNLTTTIDTLPHYTPTTSHTEQNTMHAYVQLEAHMLEAHMHTDIQDVHYHGAIHLTQTGPQTAATQQDSNQGDSFPPSQDDIVHTASTTDAHMHVDAVIHHNSAPINLTCTAYEAKKQEHQEAQTTSSQCQHPQDALQQPSIEENSSLGNKTCPAEEKKPPDDAPIGRLQCGSNKASPTVVKDYGQVSGDYKEQKADTSISKPLHPADPEHAHISRVCSIGQTDDKAEDALIEEAIEEDASWRRKPLDKQPLQDLTITKQAAVSAYPYVQTQTTTPTELPSKATTRTSNIQPDSAASSITEDDNAAGRTISQAKSHTIAAQYLNEEAATSFLTGSQSVSLKLPEATLERSRSTAKTKGGEEKGQLTPKFAPQPGQRSYHGVAALTDHSYTIKFSQSESLMDASVTDERARTLFKEYKKNLEDAETGEAENNHKQQQISAYKPPEGHCRLQNIKRTGASAGVIIWSTLAEAIKSRQRNENADIKEKGDPQMDMTGGGIHTLAQKHELIDLVADHHRESARNKHYHNHI